MMNVQKIIFLEKHSSGRQLLFRKLAIGTHLKTIPYASNEPIELFIDKLIESQETKLIENHDTIPPFSVFQPEFKFVILPPIEVIIFNGNPCQWPEFIQCFKGTIFQKFM